MFKQLDLLAIRAGTETVKLFSETSGGAMPNDDEYLKYHIDRIVAKIPEKKESLIKRASDYARAIGRIMLHSISHNHTLPCNAIPRFFMKGESLIFANV